MIQSHRISVLAPLGLSLVALVCTIIIYLVPLRATVSLIRRERRRGNVGTPWTDLGIFARVVFYASLTHLLEIAFWAAIVHDLRRILRLRNRLLSLSGELHVTWLR